MAKLNPIQTAQQTALQGDTDAAVKQLTAILDGGRAGAGAALAEIEAFRGQWPEVLRHAFAFMRDPTMARVGNSLTDVLRLAALAGFNTGGWSDLHDEVVAIRKHLLSKKELKLYAEAVAGDGFKQLIELAKSKGKADYDWGWANYTEDDEDTRDKRADTVIADKLAKHKVKKLFKEEADLRRHLFALAATYLSYKTAIRLFEQEGVDDLRTFDTTAFVATALARAGRAKDAWKVIEKAVSVWWPVDVLQVAPVALLTDPNLRPLMIPERCAQVLRTPRGPEGMAARKKRA
jgi:hypothetical protein